MLFSCPSKIQYFRCGDH